MSARLLLVRHGRTAWNRERFLGRADVPLDEVGCAQARTVAAVLGDEPVDRLWCSPLQRAVATAAPLAERCGVTPVLRSELMELDCGEWEGSLKSDPTAKISKRDPDLPLPGGESLSAAWERVAGFRRDVGEQLSSGTSVVVGHYLVNQLLLGQLLGCPLTEALRSPAYRPAPGSVLEVRRTPAGWTTHFRVTALASRR